MRNAQKPLAMQPKLSYSKEAIVECIDNIRREVLSPY